MFGYKELPFLMSDSLLTAMHSFSVLIGPINHLKHLISKERLPFSCAYIGSLALTLYFSLGVSLRPALRLGTLLTSSLVKPHSYIGSLIGAIVQVSLAVLGPLAKF